MVSFTLAQYIGLIFCFIGGSIASGCGIGGGALFVPILSFTGLNAHTAIPVSKAIICGGTIVVFLLNLKKFSKNNSHKLVIRWMVVFIMEPSTVAGVIVGVLLNRLFKSWFLQLLLCPLLVLVGHKTLKKGLKLYNKELKMLKVSKEEEEDHTSEYEDNHIIDPSETMSEPVSTNDEKDELFTDELEVFVYNPSNDESDNSFNHDKSHGSVDENYKDSEEKTINTKTSDSCTSEIEIEIDDDDDDEDKDEKLLVTKEKNDLSSKSSKLTKKTVNNSETTEENENDTENDKKETIPSFKILGFTVFTIIMFGVSFFQENFESCTSTWWMFFLIQLVVVIIALYIFYPKNVSDKLEINPITLIVGGFVAGILAALLGIGGGLVKAPVLLSLGFGAETTAATSSMMIVFTSSSSTAQYFLHDSLEGDSVIFFVCFGMISFFVGKIILQKMIDKSGHTSYATIGMAIVVILSSIIMIYSTFSTILDMKNKGEAFELFIDFCSAAQ
eukprot:TRINITY_DN1961_c0_g1_i1.p1 TRINITY_DN1961_c0_g1~~TRINITY_DN1961_c0_g1_i1.p1  ORF type:complete len:501 (+),score=127.10 TRINITY_DN1961_c0_g1_i1:23-1525(+)